MQSREDILLRAAYDVMVRMEAEGWDVALECNARYDKGDWDALTLRDDIAQELGIDSDADPITLGGNYE